jgi:hypothetical protein
MPKRRTPNTKEIAASKIINAPIPAEIQAIMFKVFISSGFKLGKKTRFIKGIN